MTFHDSNSGFEQIQHTADLALNVWAATISGLFITAAQGMYDYMLINMANGKKTRKIITIKENDLEGLMIHFLNELIFYVDSEGIAFDGYDLSFSDGQLDCVLDGRKILAGFREIKAATFHDIKIFTVEKGYSTTIVFDI